MYYVLGGIRKVTPKYVHTFELVYGSLGNPELKLKQQLFLIIFHLFQNQEK